MVRFLSRACILALLLGIMTPCGAWGTVPAPVFLTASGTFSGYEPTEDGMAIKLNVNGEEFWGILNPTCLFYDTKGNAIARDDFFDKYIKRVITVDLEESSGGIFACYPDAPTR